MRLTPVEASHRLHAGAGYVAREAGPMLLILALPTAFVLAIGLSALPAADTSPPPVVEPDAGFVYEQVGVGVRRLVHDGAGHRPGQRLFLIRPDRELIAFEPDGSVLLCCGDSGLLSSDVKYSELYRLGDEEPVFRWVDTLLGIEQANDMEVAPDGTVWVTGHGLASVDASGWTVRHGKGDIFAIQGDGTVWADISGQSLKIVRIRDGERRDFSVGRGLPPATRRWNAKVTGIAATPDGSVWVGVSAERAGRPGGLLRFDGQRWTVVRPLGRRIDARVEGVAAAPNGTLWVYLSQDARGATEPAKPSAYLARFDGREWSVLSEAEGVPYHGPIYGPNAPGVLMEAGSDGTVWLTPHAGGGCRGLVSFRDGSATSHLDKAACIEELEVAADGTAWVVAEWRGSGDPAARGSSVYLVER